jgi:hypothetical protein
MTSLNKMESKKLVLGLVLTLLIVGCVNNPHNTVFSRYSSRYPTIEDCQILCKNYDQPEIEAYKAMNENGTIIARSYCYCPTTTVPNNGSYDEVCRDVTCRYKTWSSDSTESQDLPKPPNITYYNEKEVVLTPLTLNLSENCCAYHVSGKTEVCDGYLQGDTCKIHYSAQ